MNLFKGQTRRGRTPEPTTPYQKAAQAWDERMGAARVQAKNWRLVALGLLALSCLLTIGLMTVASDSRITPYVVEVSTSGESACGRQRAQRLRPIRRANCQTYWWFYLAHSFPFKR